MSSTNPDPATNDKSGDHGRIADLPATTVPDVINQRAPGRLTGLLIKWLFRKAKVSQVEVLSERFRRITLAGEALKGVAWASGQKIQISVGGNANRTYTPISWNSETGETRILAFSHGDGPGAFWASIVQVGATCSFFGPRRSLEFDGSSGERIFLFGDETAFGLALALSASIHQTGEVALLFEVFSVEEAKRAWQACSDQAADFIARETGDAHLEEVEARTLEIVDNWSPDCFVLSGKASSIQRLRRVLGASGVAPTQMKTKAYWAPGKKGLD